MNSINHTKKYFLDGYVKVNTNPYQNQYIRLILMPHAGRTYVNKMLEDVYNQIKWDTYDRVIMLSTNHFVSGVNYQPESTTFTHNNTTYQLKNNLSIRKSDELCLNEHSWLVQMPSIDQKIPITIAVIGKYDSNLVKEINQMITDKTLLICNTDLLHCGKDYGIECVNHHQYNHDTMNMIISGNLNSDDINQRMCGSHAVKTMNTIIRLRKWNLLDKFYDASDRIKPSASASSVGYSTMIFVDSNIRMTDIPRMLLNNIDDYKSGVIGNEIDNIVNIFFEKYNIIDKVPRRYGIFVTIENRKDGELRGCIGRFIGTEPVERLIAKMTIDSAFHDSRFIGRQIKKDELPFLSFKTNFLNPPVEIYNSFNEEPYNALVKSGFKIGLHGITLYFNNSSATYLASVLPEIGVNNLTVSSFNKLVQSLRDKAGGVGNIQKIEIYECRELTEGTQDVLIGGAKYYLSIT